MPSSIGQSVLSPRLPGTDHAKITWSYLYGSSHSLALSNLAEKNKSLLVILTPDVNSTVNIVDELGAYLANTKTMPVITFPDWETLPYDLLSPHEDIISERLAVLSALFDLKKGILVVPVTTAMHRLLPIDYLSANSLRLNTGQIIQPDEFKQELNRKAYRFVGQVSEHGEVAVRGSLLDIFPMGADRPYRVDLFDDRIDSIRSFDIETQLSIQTVDSFRILPAREVALIDKHITCFRANWRAHFEGNPNQSPIYRDVSQGLAPAGIEYYLPLFYDSTSTLFDYINDRAIVVLDEGVEEAAEAFGKVVEARYEQQHCDAERPLLPPDSLFLRGDELSARVQHFSRIEISNLTTRVEAEAVEYNTDLPTGLLVDTRAKEPLALLNRFLDEFDGRVLIAAETQGRRETIMTLLKKKYGLPPVVDGWHEFLQSDIKLAIAVLPLERGLIIHQPNIAVITEAQLFGERTVRQRQRKRKQQDAETIIRNLTELKIGAPIVHEEHGVGRYCGLITLETAGIPSEFIQLEYAGGDKLYVPISALERVYRYIGLEAEYAPLHKLGNRQWEKTKRKAAEKTYDVAVELLELQAHRLAKKRQSFDYNQADYQTFIRGFPFIETPDQHDAIQAVMADMRSDRPMDRLICGDSGFGKTEVAMRAAFIAVQNNRQVALLAPTTLLAQQHYENFVNRFADWPTRIELLSRFRNRKEQDATLSSMANGRTDIVIGTHKLLQSDIRFKNPGLIIIDEEHRFGVRQKEKLKSLRANIDILTLTATPIPRTLSMALSDLRELSIIATPPERRLAVKTFIREHSDALLREALLREIRRGGQAFYLHNNVKDIERVADHIRQILPEASVNLAHGQMPKRRLESVMLDFYHRRFNVLVCTTIIETGIDVPIANTIIIDRADKFGLAQLYQLRGRVGRSHHQAYAYLIVPPRQSMAADAIKRLEAVEALEKLGIGFTLATHDLEIRGAGEVLGEGQSGHIQEIGFGLYMEFLDRAVHAIKAGRHPEPEQSVDHGVEINLHIPALIPAEFLPDVHLRLIMYKRIAGAVTDTDLIELKEEMRDRFGPLPPPAQNLFEINRLKQCALPLSVRRVDLAEKGGNISFYPKANINIDRIFRLIQSEPSTYRFDGVDRLKISKDLPDADSRLEILEYLLNEIALRDVA